MTRALKRCATAGMLTAGLLVAAPAGTAVADPKGETFQLVCGNGKTYEVVTPPGNGDFTPAHDVNSNTVLVPVEFGAFTGTIFQDGVELFSFTEGERLTKGSGKQRNTTTCSFSFRETFTVTEEPTDAEDLPPGVYEFEGSGTVVVQIKGGRNR